MKCFYPVHITVNGHLIDVPCGKCAWCAKQKRDEWYFRFKQEKKVNMYNRFLTLTYNDENLPQIIDDDGVLHPSVCKNDLQKFVKSVRNAGFHFRYFIVSEYGKLGRPHYHALVFSNEKIPYCEYWNKGFSSDYPAKEGSLKYVVKYLLKGSNVPEGSGDNFHIMSRRPGIGSSFVYKGEPYILDRGGVKLVPGRYYRKNYLDSLNEKLRSTVIESKLGFLESQMPNSSLYKEYLTLNTTQSFDAWLRTVYLNDLKIQKRISNGK